MVGILKNVIRLHSILDSQKKCETHSKESEKQLFVHMWSIITRSMFKKPMKLSKVSKSIRIRDKNYNHTRIIKNKMENSNTTEKTKLFLRTVQP